MFYSQGGAATAVVGIALVRNGVGGGAPFAGAKIMTAYSGAVVSVFASITCPLIGASIDPDAALCGEGLWGFALTAGSKGDVGKTKGARRFHRRFHHRRGDLGNGFLKNEKRTILEGRFKGSADGARHGILRSRGWGVVGTGFKCWQRRRRHFEV